MIVCGWSFFAQGFLKQRKICFFRIGLSHFYVTFVLLGNRTNDGNSAKKIFHRQYSTLQRQDVCCGTRHHRLAGRCRRCRADSDVTDMGEHLQRNISRSAGSILSFRNTKHMPHRVCSCLKKDTFRHNPRNPDRRRRDGKKQSSSMRSRRLSADYLKKNERL